jgi:two-component system nitrate/nitrite response regulator NarL
MSRATVWLVDPNTLFREGLKHLLADSPFMVTAELGRVPELSILSGGPVPDLVLLDLAGAGETAALRQLREKLPASRLVALTAELNRERLAATLEAGLDGYLLRDLSPAALVQSLQLVLLGEKVFPTSLAALLVSGFTNNAVTMPGGDRGLSERESQILRFLIHGESNKLIANRLGIAEATVKVHLKTVLRKIGVANRTQAAIWALNNGLDQASPVRAVGA